MENLGSPESLLSQSELEEEWDRIVDEAVDSALVREAEIEKKRFADDIPKPLELGPQRYTDPAIEGPDYSTYPEDSDERQAAEAGRPIPLAQDRYWQTAAQAMDKVEAAMGGWDWPGDG